jgi:O-antigen/teichoic acid export membrane protein
MNSFLNDISRVGLSKILIIIFGLLTSIITARHIGPEGNGIIASLTVYPSLFMTIGSLGIRQSTTYFLGKNVYTEGQIKTAITQIWMMTTLISLIACFLLMYFFSNSGSDLSFVMLALLPIPFSLFNTYNSGIFLGKNDIKTFNKINWIPALIGLVGTVLFVVLLKLDVKGALLASFGGAFFMFMVLLLKNKFLAFFSATYNFNIIKQLLYLGVVYATSLFIINLNYRVDIILLDKLSNAYELGIYSKGAAITQYLWQIPMLLSTIVFARSAVSKNNKQFSYKVAQLLRLSLLAIGAGSILLFVFSNVIIVGLFGSEFQESVSVLNILLPGVLLLTFFKVINMDLAGKGKPWVAVIAMTPALVINIVLNVFWIPKYGADGASLASTISYSIASVLFLILYSKETGIPVKSIIRYRRSDFTPLIQLFHKLRT